MPDHDMGPRQTPLAEITMVGHATKDADSRTSFDPKVLDGGRVISLRREVITALRNLGMRDPHITALLAYTRTLSSTLAVSLGDGWNARGVEEASGELLRVLSQQVSPADIQRFLSAPTRRRVTGALINPADERARLPQRPPVDEDGPNG